MTQEPTIIDFCAEKFCHAIGVMSGTSIGAARLPLTTAAVQAAPANFQDDVATPLVNRMIAKLLAKGVDVPSMDGVMASAVADAYGMVMQQMEAHQQRQKSASQRLIRGL